jgi:predicted ribosomally synthesized peptide with SipW-like signal peptide
MKEHIELSRRKVLAGLGTIGVASAGVGFGTSAYFSDEETYTNNSLVAGSLDMKVAYSAHYSDWSPDEDGGDTDATDDDVDVTMWDGAPGTTGGPDAVPEGMTGLPTNEAWLIAVDDPDQFLENTQYAEDGTAACTAGTDADDLEQPVIDLDDVKPGDFGEVTFDFTLCDNPGFVWLQGELLNAAENGTTEPEGKDEQELADTVELLDVVQAAAWVDDGNNYQNGDETPAIVGSLRDVLAELSSGTGLGLAGDIPAEEGGGKGRNCFSAGTTHSVAFAWWVPIDHGNEIQTDSTRFDLGFYTEQCRHNDGSGMGGGIEEITCSEGTGFGKLTFGDESQSWFGRLRYGQSGTSGARELYLGNDVGDRNDAQNAWPDATSGSFTLEYDAGASEATLTVDDGDDTTMVSYTGLNDPTATGDGSADELAITGKANANQNLTVDNVTFNGSSIPCSIEVDDGKAYLKLSNVDVGSDFTLTADFGFDTTENTGQERPAIDVDID